MSLADYLAKNYLNADPSTEKKSKKRKRKHVAAEESGGLIIADDDLTGWDNTNNGHDPEDGPQIISSRTSEFRKSKKTGWVSVGAPAPKDSEQAAADAILTDAANERRQREAEEDDTPVIEGGEDVEMGGMTNDQGTKAGLQTSAQVNAAMDRKKKEEKRRMKEAIEEAGGQADATIYRDASGRIINVAMKRAEARKKEEEAKKKAQEEEEAAKGDAQRLAKEARRKDLAEAKYLKVARTADDEELNDELKEQDRWNDPMAQLVTKKKKGKSATGKPLYKGACEPNRYGIRPGFRWDGVDRGNGFEKQWFAARNKKKDREELEYAWQLDV